MTCSPIDFICVIKNDLIGNAFLAVLFILLLYFIIASKLRFGFDTTFIILIPLSIMLGLAIGQAAGAIIAFSTIIIGIFLGIIVSRLLELR